MCIHLLYFTVEETSAVQVSEDAKTSTRQGDTSHGDTSQGDTSHGDTSQGDTEVYDEEEEEEEEDEGDVILMEKRITFSMNENKSWKVR